MRGSTTATRACAGVLLAAALLPGLRAQAPELTLPRLLHLGPLPRSAPVVELAADGVARPDGAHAGAADVVLRADANARAAAIVRELDRLRAAGAASVHVAAATTSGAAGAFVLALPLAPDDGGHDDDGDTCTLRARRGGARVPPHSAAPLLQQLRGDWERTEQSPFVLGVEVDGDAACQELVELLAVAAEAGVRCVRVRVAADDHDPGTSASHAAGADSGHAHAEPASRGTAAHDPAPAAAPPGALSLRGPFVASIPPTAASLPRPGLSRRAVGCTERAPVAAPAASVEPGGRNLVAKAPWWAALQRADGAFVDARGAVDVEATALTALKLLADGVTLDAGPPVYRVALQRCVGWLVANQLANGRFEDPGPGTGVRHAIATWVLAEAAACSARGALLHTAVDRAVSALSATRRAGGGFGTDGDGRADAAGTAWAIAAVAAAERAQRPVPVAAAALAAWFDATRDAEPTPLAAAAEFAARVTTGTGLPADERSVDLAAALLAQPDTDCAHTLFWTTRALWFRGGDAWSRWSKRLEGLSVKRQTRGGDRHGSWAPAAGRSRLGTSALHVLTLQMYYRYSKLSH